MPTARAVRDGWSRALELVAGGLRRRAAVDVRALAAFRIGLGAVLLVDLALRARDLTAFYADDGVLPRAVLAELYPTAARFSIHALSGDAWFQALLFLLAGAAAVALTVGYRTRVATVASFVLLASLHARNPTVLNSGDVLLRRLLFWGIFLPLGASWSVAAVRRADERTTVATPASLGLLVQVALVYAVNATFKLESAAWREGRAVEQVLGLAEFAAGLGPALTAFPRLLTLLTWFWLALVTLSPLLVATTGRVRGLLASLFAATHLGMAATMDLGVFPLVSLAALVPFLPSPVWDRLADSRPAGALRDLADSARDGVRRTPDDSPRGGVLAGLGLAGGPAAANADPVDASGSDGGLLPAERRARLRAIVASGLVAVLLATNAVAVGLVDAPERTPDELEDTSWAMFARPPSEDARIVARGRLATGRTIEARRLGGGPTSGTGGGLELDGRYPDARWRKHFGRYRGSPTLRSAYATALCRRWSGTDRPALRTVSVVSVRGAPDAGGAGVRTEVLDRYRCDGAVAVAVRRAGGDGPNA